jgi:hypothetical protein
MSKNIKVVTLPDGTEILFSYGVPVAAFVPGLGYVKTSKRYSKTTSTHANRYARRADGSVKEIPEVEFRALIGA